MQTKYLTSLLVQFNPFSPTRWHKTPRLLLSYLPPNAHSSGLKINTTVLKQASKERARIEVGYKDGGRVVFEGPEEGDASASASSGPGQNDAGKGGNGGEGKVEGKKDGVLDLRLMGLEDVLAEVERHSRVLRRKDELTN